jgi:hypothetical protein
VSTPTSGYLTGVAALVDAGVEFVVVGAGGINFYARDAAESVATQDLDALLAPTVANLEAALAALAVLGFAFESAGEPLLDREDESALGRVVQQRATLSARHESAGQLDLMLSIAGGSYPDFAEDAVAFRVGRVDVRVGRLEKLLASKQASGRPKDREFLRSFEARGNGNRKP